MNIIYDYCLVCEKGLPPDEDLWALPWWKPGEYRRCCCFVVCDDCMSNFRHEMFLVYCPVCKEKWFE